MDANPTTKQTTLADIGNEGFEAGDWVEVTDSKNGDQLLVLSNTGTSAREHIVNEMPEGEPDRTVHRITASNYDPDDTVIETVYLDSLKQALDEWTDEEILEMYTPGKNNHAGEIDHPRIRVYGFHSSRLEKLDN